MERIKEFILDNWDALLPQEDRPAQLRSMIIKGGLGNCGGRVTILFFGDNDLYPFLAAKISRDPKCDTLVNAEFDALHYLHSSLGPHLKGSIPKAFLMSQVDGYKVLFEEAVRGRALSGIAVGRIRNQRQVLYKTLPIVSKWLADFTKELILRRRESIDQKVSKEYFQDPIENLLRVYDVLGQERDFLESFKSTISDVARQKYPFVFEHGDFTPVNLVFFGNRFSVIDWELAQEKSLPFFDLFTLLIYSNFSSLRRAPGIYRLHNFSQLFLKDGEYSAFARKVIKDYCDILGIATSSVKTFLVLFLLNRANKEYSMRNRQAQRGYIPVIDPFGQGKNFQDGSLLKNDMSFNLLRKFIEQHSRFIFD